MARYLLSAFSEAESMRPMSAARPANQKTFSASAPRFTTLLEIVRIVGEVTDDDREVVATVLHMLESGSIQLTGNFRNAHPDDLR